MKIISQLFIFSNLFSAGLAHGLHFSNAMMNQFKSIMEPENLYTGPTVEEITRGKRNMSPLDVLFENTPISKRFDGISRNGNTMKKAADRSFFQQLSNVLTAPFKQNL